VYKVVWLRGALSEVNRILDLTANHQSVFDAMDEVDALLSHNPGKAGESREELSRRIAVVPPLVVAYRIFESQKLVLISRVGLTRV
jgi:plasmid stabilization system protein ParE